MNPRRSSSITFKDYERRTGGLSRGQVGVLSQSTAEWNEAVAGSRTLAALPLDLALDQPSQDQHEKHAERCKYESCNDKSDHGYGLSEIN